MLLLGCSTTAAVTIFVVIIVFGCQSASTDKTGKVVIQAAGQNEWNSCCEHHGVQLLLLFQATHEWRPFLWYHWTNVNHPRQSLYWRAMDDWMLDRNVTMAVASFVNRPDPGFGVGRWGNHGDLAPAYVYRLQTRFTRSPTAIINAIGKTWIDTRASMIPTLSVFEAIEASVNDERLEWSDDPFITKMVLIFTNSASNDVTPDAQRQAWNDEAAGWGTKSWQEYFHVDCSGNITNPGTKAWICQKALELRDVDVTKSDTKTQGLLKAIEAALGPRYLPDAYVSPSPNATRMFLELKEKSIYPTFILATNLTVPELYPFVPVDVAGSTLPTHPVWGEWRPQLISSHHVPIQAETLAQNLSLSACEVGVKHPLPIVFFDSYVLSFSNFLLFSETVERRRVFECWLRDQYPEGPLHYYIWAQGCPASDESSLP